MHQRGEFVGKTIAREKETRFPVYPTLGLLSIVVKAYDGYGSIN